ncbi:MAG: exodeoxyribonuclease VII small subunit [Planctomycetota bacterium]
MSKPAKKTKQDDDLSSMTFEQAIASLESINDRIESGEIGLEESLLEYERGMKLIAHCRAVLDQAEQRVEELSPERDDADTN